ncbi:MAG TPA: hypothetical protein VGZ47_04930 [Gemmataceae bacterium]|jgi:hypothetical protein|nr:hypothetical protein [Gemmataceae bacterium]
MLLSVGRWLCTLVLISFASWASAQEVASPPISLSQRTREWTVEEVMQKLSLRINVDYKSEIPLRDLLGQLEDHCGVSFHVYEDAFKALEPPLENVDETRIRLPRMTNTRLDSLLTLALQPVNGTVLVRRDHLEITTLREACRECGGPWPGFDVDLDWSLDQSFFFDFRLPFVQMSFTNRPLNAVFAQLMAVYNDQNIVFAPEAMQRMKVPVTGRLLNVPLNQALEVLAKLADLEAVTCGKITLITTAEKAAPMLKDLAERRAVRRIQSLLEEENIYATPEQIRALFLPPASNSGTTNRSRARISWDEYARNVREKQSDELER